MTTPSIDADVLKPSAPFSRAGKASVALYITHTLIPHNEANKSPEKHTRKEVEQAPEEDTEGPHASDRGRETLMSSSPRHVVEWDLNQTSGIKSRTQKILSGDQPSKLVTDFIQKAQKAKSGEDGKSPVSKEKVNEVEKLFESDSESEDDIDAHNMSLRKKQLADRHTSSFMSPDRWKEPKRFEAPPVGHYRPRLTITSTRSPAYDFGAHATAGRKTKSDPLSPIPQEATQAVEPGTPNNATPGTSVSPTKGLEETGRQSPSRPEKGPEEDTHTSPIAKGNEEKYQKPSTVQVDPHLLMPLPKSNICGAAFKSKSPQRPTFRSFTPDPYTPNIDLTRQSAPAFSFSKEYQYILDIGRPTTAPPQDLVDYPHGSAYDVNLKLVKPSAPLPVPFDLQLPRERWSPSKAASRRKREYLEPIKPSPHSPTPDFDKMLSRDQLTLSKDKVDRQLEPFASYEYEVARDSLGPRSPSPDMKRMLPRKDLKSQTLDKFYDIPEKKIYANRYTNVHDFSKAPGHKDLTMNNQADLMYDSQPVIRRSPSPDMSRQIPRNKAQTTSTRGGTSSLDVVYNPDFSIIQPRLKGDPMIERQLARSGKIF
eukprot:TRINITY_DN3748_c0_g2_i2.p1 TRINITY_DN3748_c0_g2~~TRINITY_DN3748_c0_g2_i2.p1  ORF type:complete len:595 (+),score=86.15 TRINITY_DN3748_c0_g2_i2:49-1833(+)